MRGGVLSHMLTPHLCSQVPDALIKRACMDSELEACSAILTAMHAESSESK